MINQYLTCVNRHHFVQRFCTKFALVYHDFVVEPLRVLFLIAFFLLLSAILRNEVGWYDEEEHNSSLVAARLATDAADVKSAIAERISVILQNMTSLLTSFIVAFIVEWRVSLLILATFPLLVLANFAQVSTTTDSNPFATKFLTQDASLACSFG